MWIRSDHTTRVGWIDEAEDAWTFPACCQLLLLLLLVLLDAIGKLVEKLTARLLLLHNLVDVLADSRQTLSFTLRYLFLICILFRSVF